MSRNNLMKQILFAIGLGIVTGWGCHHYASSPGNAKEIASYFSIITDVFLKLIKMIIAPLVFATIVSGIVSMKGSSSVGSIALKAMTWFISAAIISLFIGMSLVNIFKPGVGLNMVIPHTDVATGLSTSAFSLKAFISQIFPTSFAGAMANNDIIQILVFSVFFGSALSFISKDGNHPIIVFIEDLTRIMFRVTEYVMKFTPFAVFSAIAAAITVEGLGLIYDYGKLIGLFYLGLVVLWACLFAVGYLFLGKPVFTLGKLIYEPTALAFATASSESAYPKTMDALTKFGVPKKVSSFVLPLGYSFNLDGSMMYQAFAVLFIAQAYNIPLSFTEQVLILLTLMVTSKGMAGVARASVVVVAATLPMFNLPESGILLILGIDQFLDMGRTATNVVGNSISAAVIAKLEDRKKTKNTVR
ncbi:dicarboxylate/amino acid:cation symporter [Tatumella sp. JGM118]|uniref:dicarboxylate/amino acid:cation symporter n=1 Tax=Tatumella sp. JGM118 TaxID=2799796 RepID=UPI001BAEB226|nr:dicarboxylate/amino acid:cation symporter [Tatumella sp. JGM118]MBS0908500.1 dicarboxylate/amino acid:cation symporter [Tatumella sp. JGM118]